MTAVVPVFNLYLPTCFFYFQPKVITLQTQQNVFNISRQFAYQGNQLAVSEEYDEAIRLFSRAISLLPSDCRYYGNRSFCYDRLEKYEEWVTLSL